MKQRVKVLVPRLLLSDEDQELEPMELIARVEVAINKEVDEIRKEGWVVASMLIDASQNLLLLLNREDS